MAKHCLLARLNWAGKKRGPHSALFIYLIHFVGGTTGLADASGHRPMCFFGSEPTFCVRMYASTNCERLLYVQHHEASSTSTMPS